jgi:AraC-like DNA-binding protein
VTDEPLSSNPPAGVDRLSALFEHCRVRARLFHSGPLCGRSSFPAQPGRGFLHVLRRGEVTVTHPPGSGLPTRLRLTEPSLLFYPAASAHAFDNPPTEGSDFTCASLEFDGGDEHPLVKALPGLVVLPLAEIEELQLSLRLLFAETERVRCGQRLLADRLFEVVLLQLMRWLLDHPQPGMAAVGLLAGLADARLARVLSALHERPGARWTLAGMASLAAMSRSGFAAHFKQIIALSPMEYLTRWRLQLAQAALARGRPLQVVANELGYAHGSALSRLFRQHLRSSPRLLRRDQLDPTPAQGPAGSVADPSRVRTRQPGGSLRTASSQR